MDYFEIIDILSLFFGEYLALLLAAGAVYLVMHVLQGIGQYTLAKRAGLKHTWMAFVPFLNSYQLGGLAGESSFFGQKMKHAGIYYAVSEFVAFVAYTFSLVVEILLDPYLYIYDDIYYDYKGYPESLNWAYTADTVLTYVVPLLRLLYFVFMMVVLFSFFRKYAARNSAVFSICAVFFPVKGAFIFAVRKNVPVNYEQYMRAQREEYYRRQQQQYYRDPYNRPPDNSSTQNENYYQYGQNTDNRAQEEPFSEFSESEKKNETESDRSENDEFFGRG